MTMAETPAVVYVRHRRERARELVRRFFPEAWLALIEEAIVSAYDAGYEDGQRDARVSEPER